MWRRKLYAGLPSIWNFFSKVTFGIAASLACAGVAAGEMQSVGTTVTALASIVPSPGVLGEVAVSAAAVPRSDSAEVTRDTSEASWLQSMQPTMVLSSLVLTPSSRRLGGSRPDAPASGRPAASSGLASESATGVRLKDSHSGRSLIVSRANVSMLGHVSLAVTYE